MKVLFRTEAKDFSDRRKPRELMANRPALKELLKKFSK